MTDKPWNESRPAKGLHPSDAESWWYGDRDGIAVVIASPMMGVTLSARITRSQIEKYIREVKPRRRKK